MRTMILFLLIVGCAHNSTDKAAPSVSSCTGNPELQKTMSARLNVLENEDQSDRNKPFDQINWAIVSPRDIQRREEVAEMAKNNCLQSAQDYAHAAMVYQHGDTAEHALQAAQWAKKAVELGSEKQKWLAAAGIDRYLVRTKRKQLYATQFSRNDGEKCWCMDPVEESFPDFRRKQMTGKTLEESRKAFMKTADAKCKELKVCNRDVEITPAGTVPGFW